MDNINGVHIIDCLEISSKPLAEIQDTEEFKNFSEKFGNAMKLNGIVYLINTGIEKETISNFEEKLAEFYSLPLDVKRKYDSTVLTNFHWGWYGPDESKLAQADTIETLVFMSNVHIEDDSLYPNEISGLKETHLAFRKRFRLLSTKLLRSLGEYFKLEDKDFFIHQHSALEENYAKSRFMVRSLYYPVHAEIPESAPEYRLIPHQDLGTLAHLYQNSPCGGLQAKLHTGEYVDIEYIPNSFVVNAGRSLEMWSGGNIPAVIHRVGWTERSKTMSRITLGCFLGPDNDACCLPVVEENPHWVPSYPKMEKGETFGDYFKYHVRRKQNF